MQSCFLFFCGMLCPHRNHMCGRYNREMTVEMMEMTEEMMEMTGEMMEMTGETTDFECL